MKTVQSIPVFACSADAHTKHFSVMFNGTDGTITKFMTISASLRIYKVEVFVYQQPVCHVKLFILKMDRSKLFLVSTS